ncbi:MAG: phage baseplate assembly protein V [Bacteroidota bacterium]
MDENTIDLLLELVQNRYFGKYRATVKDNEDPTGRGRVKVEVPSVLQDVQAWAEPCLPYAGNKVGLFCVPEVDSGVWVEFEGGDPSFPIYTGGFWGSEEVPVDTNNQAADHQRKIIRSKTGLQICFDDADEVLTLSDQDGSNIITLEIRQDTIKIVAPQKVIIESRAIELKDGAPHPVVFGDELMSYLDQLVQIFNTHTHPGELALGILPVTPNIPAPQFLPPNRPVLLSRHVNAG